MSCCNVIASSDYVELQQIQNWQFDVRLPSGKLPFLGDSVSSWSGPSCICLFLMNNLKHENHVLLVIIDPMCEKRDIIIYIYLRFVFSSHVTFQTCCGS